LLSAYRHTAIGHWTGSGWVTGHSSAQQRGSGRVGSEKKWPMSNCGLLLRKRLVIAEIEADAC